MWSMLVDLLLILVQSRIPVFHSNIDASFSVEDCYRKEITLDDEKIMLEIIDTAGTEQFTSMVELYIKNCQVLLDFLFHDFSFTCL
jgi:GTPase SAR1 family protein